MLTLLTVGSALCFAPLLGVETFPAIALTLAIYACFASSITPMVDSLALNRVNQVGGSFAHLRLFGSLGFIAISTTFGLVARELGRLTVVVPLALLGLLALWSLSLRSNATPSTSHHPLAGLRLLRDNTDLRWLLAATCLHWMACSPYNGMLAIHILAQGLPPSVVGLAAGVGVAAEVPTMLFYPRFAHLLAPRYLLGIAFALSAVRWAGMALVSSPTLLVGLSLLHSMTFGVFYLSSVAFMARRVPPHLRASGQGLFAAVTFGIGGLMGHTLSGVGYSLLGGHALFGVAGLLELVAVLFVLQSSPAITPIPPTEGPAHAPPP